MTFWRKRGSAALTLILSFQMVSIGDGALKQVIDPTKNPAVLRNAINGEANSQPSRYYDAAINDVTVPGLARQSSPNGFYRSGIQTKTADPSLMLWLSFDNDFSQGPVSDISGHGGDAYNLNVTNPVVPSIGRFGRAGFWGRSYPMGDYSLGPYLAITNYGSFEFLTNGTISVWAWPNTNSGQTTALIDAGYPTMTNSWSLRRYYNTSFSLTVWTNDSINDMQLLFPSDTIGYPNFATRSWHHYCVTWQGRGPAIAYYDGSPVATNTLPVPWLQVGSLRHWVGIGCWTHNNSDLPDGTGPNNGWMGGLMDDVRIYNRALPAAEVKNLYVGGE